MNETVLKINHFSKSYSKTKRAVDDLSLEVCAGDIYGFIGQNGAGKTTTLRAVTGILDFSEGEILIDGKSIKEQPVACKQITAYIPDNPDLYEFLTGVQYLNYIGDIYGVPDAVRKERIQKYAAMFHISDDLGALIGSYSHGMKQKLAVISALLHEPKLFVLDEPFVGLDPEAAFNLKNVFRELCGRGAAIFFSTHVLDVAEKLCNKIAIIKGGKLMASGDIDAVRGDDSLEEVFMEVLHENEG
ncbi:MAG TPA: ABC transporter ATP-binding protein [Candidatus Borkfalkia excrementavium]|uniref:ABC transporter ATP-binding protein n=1 Tax=Candidatus Borkfalkia excrementavium TaxID=2838505 RepID=A0A9D1Z7F1_9FIRM|nr:ABC transporter ATP-binding protein [Candidatus Borkfalkia excrementavium]